MKKQQGVTLWFTGLPCCGKTTIADRVAALLEQKGYHVERLDGDIVRRDLTKDLGFSKKDRDENIRRVSILAQKLTRQGSLVLATFVSPYKEQRRNARKMIGAFIEVYVRCPIEVCKKRDVKGMYQKASEGLITHFTGVDDPYEEPEQPELIVDADKETIDESVRKVMKILHNSGYIS